MLDLPKTVAVFLLEDCILIPNNQLSLHIFEPRYRQMINDALSEDRMIGVIQSEKLKVGCLGQITEHKELEDGRFLVFLLGLSKFTLTKEVSIPNKLYRSFNVNYIPEESLEEGMDHMSDEALRELDHYSKLLFSKEDYEQKQEIHPATWINHLAQSYSFDSEQKQKLLEVSTYQERLDLLLLYLKNDFAEKCFGSLDTIH